MPEDQKRNRLPMMIRFAPGERALLDEEAAHAGTATGTWIRTTALAVAKENARKRARAPSLPDTRPKPAEHPAVKSADVASDIRCTATGRNAAGVPVPCAMFGGFHAGEPHEFSGEGAGRVAYYLALARRFNATAEGPEANALAVELQRVWDGMSEAEQEEARAKL